MTDDILLTDGGLETALIFLEGVDLRDFAAFELLETAAGRATLARYWQPFFELAARTGRGFVLDTPTWRASTDWGARLGYDAEDIARINREAGVFAAELRRAAPAPGGIRINGVVGPRGDGYVAEAAMGPAEAESYHRHQINALAMGPVDQITAVTMTNVPEAIGVLWAANDADLPVSIGFTVETDGRLPSGTGLAEAIAEVDAASPRPPSWFMINCAHPEHFAHVLDGPHAARIGALRCNASRLSHAELDAADALDAGDPVEFGTLTAGLAVDLPQIRVLGGCCGTDHRHLERLAAALGRKVFS
ncbi:MAG: homocysteine S-methyltransferase family protein [Pseudomonadota bacterium]